MGLYDASWPPLIYIIYINIDNILIDRLQLAGTLIN